MILTSNHRNLRIKPALPCLRTPGGNAEEGHTDKMLFGWERLTQEELDRIENGIVDNTVYGGPLHLEIEPTDACNLNCFFCCTDWFRHGDSIPWETLKATLEEGVRGGLRFLKLSGGGESLVYSSINPLLDFCAQNSLRIVDLTTNGTLLAQFAQRIVDIGADLIYISLNEPSAKRYSQTMRVPEAVFHKAIRGVEAVCAARDAARPDQRPTVALQFFVWRDNYRLLPEMYRFAHQLGVDQVIIKTLLFLKPEQRIPPEEHQAARETILGTIEEDTRRGDFKLRFDLSREGGELNSFALQEQQKRLPQGVSVGPRFDGRNPRREFCLMPWYSATIGATGAVYPCCVFVEERGKTAGNIYKESLTDIWRGKQYQRMRTLLRQLMILGGDMEYSRKLHSCLEPPCIHRYSCYFAYHLCSEEFYQKLGERMDRAAPFMERVSARLRNSALRATHKILHRLRQPRLKG